jgi:hypothetical protein
MGKTRAVPASQTRTVSIVSPLLLWSHEFAAAVLFDGTGELFPYPKDSCMIVPATVTPQPVLHIKLLPVSGNKPLHQHRVAQSPDAYYVTIRTQLSSILMALAQKHHHLYVCTWRDKEPEAYEHATSTFSSHEVEVERIVRIKDRPHFEVEPLLKLEMFLRKLVHDLTLEERIFVSHYGLTRGSNQFIHYDGVLLVGHFYYPGWKYHDFSTFSRIFSPFKQTTVPAYTGNPLPLVLSHLLQECMRTRARTGHPVDCYLCLDRQDSDYDEILSGLQTLQEFGYYVHSIEESDLHGAVVASEQLVKFQYIIRDLLTHKQEARMVKLAEAYPHFLDARGVDIDAAELGRLWQCRPDDVVKVLQSIEDRSQRFITHRIIAPGQRGGRSALFRIDLQPVA